MIDSYEMAQIYWRRLKKWAIKEVESMVKNVKSEKAKIYWNDVLTFLDIRKNGKGKQH